MSEPARSRRRWRHGLSTALGLVVSVVFGYLAVRGLSLNKIGDALSAADYTWLAPAFLTLLVGLWMRSERWRALFPAAERPSSSATFWALSIGYLFNNVLPARAGEVARVLALSRETGLSRTHGLVTVLVERIFDLAVLAVLMLAALVVLPHDNLVHELAIASGAILVVAAIAVAAIAIPGMRRRVGALVPRLPVVGGERASRTMRSLALGVTPLRDPRLALPVLLWSLGSWLVLGLSGWFVLQAFPAAHAPWHAALLALVATNLAQVVPSTAAAIGVWEAAARAALTAYGTSAALALSYGLVLHALNLVVPVALGLLALARLGLSGRELVGHTAGTAE